MTASIAAAITIRPATQDTESWTGKPQRRITTEYVLEEGTDSKGQRTEVLVTLTTAHRPDSKKFHSSITRWRRTYEDIFRSDLCSLLEDSATVRQEKVERYSFKGLQAVHAEAELLLADLIGHNSKVDQIFDASLAPSAA